MVAEATPNAVRYPKILGVLDGQQVFRNGICVIPAMTYPTDRCLKSGFQETSRGRPQGWPPAEGGNARNRLRGTSDRERDLAHALHAGGDDVARRQHGNAGRRPSEEKAPSAAA